MRNTILRRVGLLALLTAAAALGQTTTPHVVNISFEFTAGDKVLPAGRYTISSTVGPMPWVKTQGIRNKAITQLFTIARLAPGDAPSDKLRLVFDKIGDRRFLSEVWFPKSDGLLVRGTPEEHKHEVLKSEQ